MIDVNYEKNILRKFTQLCVNVVNNINICDGICSCDNVMIFEYELIIILQALWNIQIAVFQSWTTLLKTVTLSHDSELYIVDILQVVLHQRCVICVKIFWIVASIEFSDIGFLTLSLIHIYYATL